MGIILDKFTSYIYTYLYHKLHDLFYQDHKKSFIDFKNTFCTWFGFFKFLASLLHNDENHLQSSRVTLWWALLSAMIQSICWHRYICLMYPHSNYHQYNLHLGHHHYDARKEGKLLSSPSSSSSSSPSSWCCKGGSSGLPACLFLLGKGKGVPSH